jgi:hypothetical protein
VILTIDNLAGLGAEDYSAALDRSEPLTITRTLNAPSIAHGLLCLAGTTLASPVRQARVTLTSDAGTLLFTGYLATEPVAIYAGVASAGPVYRLAFSAVSDEWLLDKQSVGALSLGSLQTGAGAVVGTLANRLDAGRLNTAGLSGGRPVGVFEPTASATWSGQTWSTQAGEAANAAYSAYRALGGALTMTPIGDVTHALSDGDGTLSVAALKTSAVRELANDVTVSGAMEPAAYWTELFTGDGATTVFDLAGEPDAPGAGHATLIADDFTGATLNFGTWELNDPGAHLNLSGGPAGGGLTLNGGNGHDGQTTLTAVEPVELGGTLVLQLAEVALSAGSAGVLGGLYQGSAMQANCVAGFSISQSAGNTVLQPLVNGLVTGTPFTLLEGHPYTLRLHLHSPEMLRIGQSFYAMVDGLVQQFGGALAEAPLAMVFEVRDLGDSSNTPVTVLYDGSAAASPAQANLVAVNSIGLYGTLGAVELTRTGSAWIVSTDPTTGIASTRLAGKSTDGVDCTLTSSTAGRVTFFDGRVPVVGEQIAVRYRGRRRAVARLADAASLATEAAGGVPGTARWLGKVVRPVARSTADCENAAQAILSFASNRAAAVTGSYEALNPATDIWPGDLLALTANGVTTSVVVRRLEIQEQGASPEVLTYKIAFANDWAEALGVTLSEAIAADAIIPLTALELASGAGPPVLANLQQLTVTAV